MLAFQCKALMTTFSVKSVTEFNDWVTFFGFYDKRLSSIDVISHLRTFLDYFSQSG